MQEEPALIMGWHMVLSLWSGFSWLVHVISSRLQSKGHQISFLNIQTVQGLVPMTRWDRFLYISIWLILLENQKHNEGPKN